MQKLHESNISIGSFVKYHRLKRGLTQEKLATGVCSIPYLSKLENGHLEPSSDVLELLCNRLNVKYNHNQLEEIKIIKRKLNRWYLAIQYQSKEEIIHIKNELDQLGEMVNHPDIVITHQLFLLRYYLFIDDIRNAHNIIGELSTLNLSTDEEFYLTYFTGIYECMIGQQGNGLKYLQKAEVLGITNRLEDPSLLYHLSLTYSHLLNTSLAIHYGKMALDLFNASSNVLRVIDTKVILGINYNRILHVREATNYYESSLKMSSMLKLDPISATIYHNLGLLYAKQQKYSDSIDSFLKCIEIKKKNNLDYGNTIFCLIKEYVNIEDGPNVARWLREGLIVTSQKDQQTYYNLKMLEYKVNDLMNDEYRSFVEDEVLPFFQSMNDYKCMITCAKNLAEYYSKKSLYKKSSQYYSLCSEYLIKISNYGV